MLTFCAGYCKIALHLIFVQRVESRKVDTNTFFTQLSASWYRRGGVYVKTDKVSTTTRGMTPAAHCRTLELKLLTRPQATDVLAEAVYKGYPLFVRHVDERGTIIELHHGWLLLVEHGPSG